MSEKRTLWLMGLPCSGKTTLAKELIQYIDHAVHLDGDVLRNGLCSDLGFSAEDRRENIRRAAETAALLNKQGIDVVASFITPLGELQRLVYETLNKDSIIIYVRCPGKICEMRDVKGMYAKARAGEIKGFTGLDAPFHVPSWNHLTVNTDDYTLDECVKFIKKRTGI